MVVASAPDAPLVQPLQLPQQLAAELRLTPEQFELVCQANPDAVLELSAEGHLITMTPTGSDTSVRNSTLLVLLGMAVRSSALPLKLFDSSGGFRLPDGSVLSPDAALVRRERWDALTPAQQRSFAPLCPVARRPCATRWSSIAATAPNGAGCCCPPTGPSKSGALIAKLIAKSRPSASPLQPNSTPATCSPAS